MEFGEAKLGEIKSVIHGATVATNTILQFKMAKTGLITNEGLTDVLEIGRMDRPSEYDLPAQRPKALVLGRWRVGVQAE